MASNILDGLAPVLQTIQQLFSEAYLTIVLMIARIFGISDIDSLVPMVAAGMIGFIILSIFFRRLMRLVLILACGYATYMICTGFF